MHLASMLLTLFICGGAVVAIRAIRRKAGTSLRRATQTGRSGPHLPHGGRRTMQCIVRLLHSYTIVIAYSPGFLGQCKSSMNCSRLTRNADDHRTSMVPDMYFHRITASPCSSRICALSSLKVGREGVDKVRTG